MRSVLDLSPVDFGAQSDHQLLDGGLDDEVAANVFAARRLARLDEFRCRMERDHQARRANDPYFALTPIQETVVEAGELWGLSEGRIRADLRTARTLKEHFPGIWELCCAGALDTYQASLVAETAKFSLEWPREYAKFAERITAWLKASIPTEGERPRLVNRTVKQLRNKITYEVNKLKPKDAGERFQRAFKDRNVRAQLGEDGIGHLGISNSVTDIQLADYRLTLIAKALRAVGDERTLDQIRADTAIDLIVGKVAVDATIAELEDEDSDDGGEGRDPAGILRGLPTSNYARPVINVTVPIQTLMGVSDHPGVLSGGAVIPAALARQIAQDPESSWYRMLTDEHGHMVELSTKSYRPTKPIWRDVVARHTTCYRRNCDKPATLSELDHKVKWPKGPTSNKNLGPACKPDHKGKHADGFSLEQNPDGTLTFNTRAGFAHTTELVEHPVADWPEEALFESQFTATEILDAIGYLRFEQQAIDASIAADMDEDERWLMNCAS